MTKFIGYLVVKPCFAIPQGRLRMVEWSFATGYTVDGATVGRSMSDLKEYVEFCEENDVLADEELKRYLGE